METTYSGRITSPTWTTKSWRRRNSNQRTKTNATMQRITTSHLKPLLRSPNPKPKTPPSTMSTPKSKPFNSSTALLPLPPSLPPTAQGWNAVKLYLHVGGNTPNAKWIVSEKTASSLDSNLLLLHPDLHFFFVMMTLTWCHIASRAEMGENGPIAESRKGGPTE